MVNTIATTKTAYPALYDLNSCTRFLATNAQNIITGTAINNMVTMSDLASGPNINLPPRINFCKRDVKKVFRKSIQENTSLNEGKTF